MTSLHPCKRAFALLGFALMAQISHAQAIRIAVDLTDAPRNIYHAKLNIPVKPGPFTLVYPKWIPGNHRPSGPVHNLTGLRMEASGRAIPGNAMTWMCTHFT